MSSRHWPSHSDRADAGSSIRAFATSCGSMVGLRVELPAFGLNDENIVAVFAEVRLVLIPEKAGFSLGRADRNQHRVRERRQARHDGAIDLKVGRRAFVRSIEGDFV
jgi:hypothetical protein